MKRANVRTAIVSMGIIAASFIFFFGAGNDGTGLGKAVFPGKQISSQNKTKMASDIGPGNYRVKQLIPLGPVVGNGISARRIIISTQNNAIYTVNEYTINVSVIDRTTNELIKTIEPAWEPYGTAIDNSLNRMYTGYSDIIVYDLANGQEIKRINGADYLSPEYHGIQIIAAARA